MRKIKICEHISLDGVIEHGGDYEYGAWTTPYRTPEGQAMLLEAYGNNFDLLLGRSTYDSWLNFWPNAGNFPMANGINSATKYIVTHRPESLSWGPVKDLGKDVLEGIRSLKSTEGPDLVVSGSISLTSLLLDAGLVDELILVVYPVLLSRGKRLLSENFNAREFKFISTATSPTGLLLSTYRHIGALKK
jgi:dihydrofolate reductase